MNRNQTLHERLIPLLVEGIGAESYLEFGTYLNETISRVKCERRYGVDLHPVPAPGVIHFTMTTAQFISDIAKMFAPFDFVFIDADHSAEAVREDFQGIYPHVAPEGLIVCHDTNPGTKDDTAKGLCGDAWKFARELTVDYESVTLPYHPGLTIVRKRQTWIPNEAS